MSCSLHSGQEIPWLCQEPSPWWRAAGLSTVNKQRCCCSYVCPMPGRSFRIGITGVPGVGKSTLIEQLGLLAIAKITRLLCWQWIPAAERRVVVSWATRPGWKNCRSTPVFIRPSAAGTTLGGVAGSTREAIILLEAAGYDLILVETVGVGQSETAVHSMTDLFFSCCFREQAMNCRASKEASWRWQILLRLTKQMVIM